ncbi:hypothetical protein EON80_04425 [bacterium]|nr:MAG: hypothetical protein EON80_04425 [bacterium]
MSRKVRWREAVVLLPPLGLLGFGFGLQRWEAAQQRDEAKRQRELDGPYRAIITRVEPLEVNAIEAAAGFDAKFKIHSIDLGHPSKVTLSEKDRRVFRGQLQLVGRFDGREVRLRSDAFYEGFTTEVSELCSEQKFITSGLVREPRFAASDGEFMVLAKTTAFPARAEVKVEGPMDWELRNGGTANQRVWKSQPVQFSHVVRRPHQKLRLPAFAPSPLRISRFETAFLSPQYQHTSLSSDGNNAWVKVVINTPTCSTYFTDCYRWLNTQLTDQEGKLAGKVVMNSGYGGAPNEPHKVWTGKSLDAGSTVGRGELRFQGSLAFEGTKTVPLDVEVRPAWITAKPTHLQLESVKVVANKVEVTVRYSGQRKIFAKNSVGQILDHRSHFEDPAPWWNDTQNDYLLSDWSQHLRIRGREYWYPNSIKVREVYLLGNGLYRIDYETNTAGALKAGEYAEFKAEIGLKGEGFLPVRAKVR